MNEEYTSPRSREYFKNQKLVKQYQRNAKANPRTDLQVKPTENITAPEEKAIKPVNVEKSDLWQAIFRAYKKSGIRDNMPLIQNMLKKAKEGSKLEKQWIATIGKQIITNEHTIGKNVGKPIEQPAEKQDEEPITESYSVVTNDIPKKLSLLANAILPFRNNIKAIEQLGEPGGYITSFIKSYDEIKAELQPKETTSQPKEQGETQNDKPNDKLAEILIDYLKTAPKVKSDYGNYTIGEHTDEEIKKDPSKVLNKLIEDWGNQKDSDEKTNELDKLKDISSKSKETETNDESEIVKHIPVEIKTEKFNILRFNKFLSLKEAAQDVVEDTTDATATADAQPPVVPTTATASVPPKTQDEVEDTTGVADVKEAWSKAGFEEGEEKQWAINPREIERVTKKIENDTFEISLTDEKDDNKKEGEDAKDRIIKIANLLKDLNKLAEKEKK